MLRRCIYFLLYKPGIFFLIIYSGNLHSQSYNFRNFNVDEGLAQSQVNSICQDQEGKLYFGTLGGGVSVYNGLNFETYTTREGLIDNAIYVLFTDSRGSVWMGTGNGVSRFIPPTPLSKKGYSKDNANGRFINYSIDHGLLRKRIMSMNEDLKGNIWIGTYGGISMLPEENIIATEQPNFDFSKTSKLFKNFTVREDLLDSIVSGIERDNAGNMYFVTRKGINKLNFIKRKGSTSSESGKTVLYFDKITEKEGLADYRILNQMKDNLGNLWFLTPKGLSRLDPTASQNLGRTVIKNFFSDDQRIFSRNNSCIMQDNKANIWVGTMDNGLFKIKVNEDSNSIEITDNITKTNGLPTDFIWNLFEDREGNLWIGTDGGGVAKFRGKMFESFSTQDGLSDQFVFKILETRNNQILIGTFTNGLNILDPLKPGTLRDKISYFNIKEGLPDGATYDLMMDHSGNIWIGTLKGLVRIDYVNGSLDFKKPKIYTKNDGLISERASVLFEDSKNRIWVGAMLTGITIIDRSDPLKEIFYTIENNRDNPVYYPRDFLEDKAGNIWIATRDGVSILKNGYTPGKKLEFDQISLKEGLLNNYVLSIFEDKNGNIWFGTQGGVSKLILNKDEGYVAGSTKYLFKNFTKNDGLSSDMIYLINMDDEGNMWFGTNKGIDQYLPERNTFRNFGKADGFLGIETNHNATLKDSKGNLWFGTIKGVTKYYPSEASFNSTPPVTLISKLRVYFKEIELPDNHIFPYFQNYLTFDFIGTSLTVPEKVKYQWKLEGFDNDWLPVTQETRVTYSNIPHGKYTFMVRACNDNNLWNEFPATYSFEITPPFWKTWWFYALCTAVGVGILFGYIKWREKKLMKEKMILETKVKERTSELAKANEQLEQDKEKIEKFNLELEDKNKKITQSINYAKRIQNAILPPAEFVKKYLPDSFILYKPRDIVSGDFYWMEVKNNHVLIAAVDCTGHGVPGALMSILGYNLLNQAVKDDNYTQPSKILENLNNGLSNVFRIGYEETKVRDGMDIALCAIDFTNKKVVFSGAYNPLYIIRNKKLIISPANKFPIGQYLDRVIKIFHHHETSLEKGDALYMFSDGYADQFGGPNDRKFYRMRFQELLLEIQDLNMDEQKIHLDKVITEWRGNRKQLDDMLVVGIRI